MGVVKLGQLHLINGEWDMHPEGIFIHTTQYLDILIYGSSANVTERVVQSYSVINYIDHYVAN